MSVPAGTGDEPVYTPTSGTGTGWVGVVLALCVVGIVLVDDRSLNGARYALGALLFGLLMWCFMLRPRIVIGSEEVELRNALSSWHVPLAGVRKAEVRAVTMLHTDHGRFNGVAVGRPVRSLVRGQNVPRRTVGLAGLGGQRVSEGAAASRQPMGRLDANRTADLVVEQVLFAADRAREAGQQPAAPRRTWAKPEIAVLVLVLVGFVVSLLV